MLANSTVSIIPEKNLLNNLFFSQQKIAQSQIKAYEIKFYFDECEYIKMGSCGRYLHFSWNYTLYRDMLSTKK